MAQIAWPAAVKIRNIEWAQPPVVIRQRSAWTGRTREVELGSAERWTAQVELVPMREAALQAWRAFAALLSVAGNHTRLPMVTPPQREALAAAWVAPPPLGATTGTISTAQTDGEILPAGALIGILLTGGESVVTTLTAPLIATAGGQAVAHWQPPLRRATALSGVELASPSLPMRASAPLRWASSPGGIGSVPVIEFEEAF